MWGKYCEMILNREEKKLLLEIICDEQIRMIVKDHTRYESEKYVKLEELKVKIKDMWGDYYSRHYYVRKWGLHRKRKML